MKRIDPLRWRELSPRLDELLDLDAPQRAARLAALHQEDAALADELAALLALQDRIESDGFLTGTAVPADDAPLVGQTLGAYTIDRLLGAGGMGSVWLAHRSDGRYEGQVAFKLLNLSLLGRGGAERFGREGQVLARLTHPNIARLLDAGVSAAGQPYLVLEHVDGEPIDRWCEARALSVEARVRLMLEVLAAVAHAHSKLVLHRDLKPANILVTADGRVKLLDFGIAKLLDDGTPAAPAAELTQQAGRAFTPDYAAPEQIDGGEVSTATDVYALGVLLYVLLAGVHPTAKPTDTPAQRLRAVVDTDAQRLSDAAGREAGAAHHAGALRGDLDNICAKALKKLPAERYATAESLAEDLRRYLAHEPVSARADSLAYRSAKFVRRHRFGVAATLLLLLALSAGIVGTAWQAVEARRQHAEALQQRDRAQALLGRNEAIAEFIGTMFTEALPAGQAKAVQQMLERSEPLIDSVFANKPAQQAELLRVLASYYTALSLPAKQVELLERARGIVAQVPDPSLRARLDCDHAVAAATIGKLDEAMRLIEPWLADRSIDAAVAGQCLQIRAQLAQNANDAPAALAHAQAGLQRLREAGNPVPRLEAALLGDVAFAQHLAGDNSAADASYQAALDRLQAIGRADGFDAQRLRIDRGVVRTSMSDYRGALAMFDAALRTAERQGGDVVPPGVVANRAFTLEQLGRYDEALQEYARTREVSRRNGFVAGESYAIIGRASVLALFGRPAEAQAALAEADPLLAPLPAAHSSRTRYAIVQARIHLARGEAASAAEQAGSVITRTAAQGAVTPALANAHRLRAEAALQRGDPAAARTDADQALALARRLQGRNPHSELTGQASLTLGRVLRAAGDAAAAAAALTTARGELLAALGAEHPDTRAAEQLLARR